MDISWRDLLSDQFVQFISAAKSFSIGGDSLFLHLEEDTGTMKFISSYHLIFSRNPDRLRLFKQKHQFGRRRIRWTTTNPLNSPKKHHRKR